MVFILVIIIVFILTAYRTFIKKILDQKKLQHIQEIEHQKEISLQFALVQENERKRIAKILHDDVGNKLNILSLWINNEDTWNSDRSKEVIVKQIPALIESTRTISHQLYPSNLEQFGLVLTLEEMISNMNKSLSVQLIMHHKYEQRPPHDEVQMYRIVQEFISNTIKHAQATKIDIQIRESEKKLSILLCDNGIGFEYDQRKKGMGLSNIESRIQSLNGLFRWNTNIKNGTQLLIILWKE